MIYFKYFPPILFEPADISIEKFSVLLLENFYYYYYFFFMALVGMGARGWGMGGGVRFLQGVSVCLDSSFYSVIQIRRSRHHHFLPQ